MAWKKSFLVVANVTADSAELREALQERARTGPTEFMLIVPATVNRGGRVAAGANLSRALNRLREVGLEADGQVGDGDPLTAVSEAWDPRRYDEIIVSTLPMRFSKWLHAGLPERIGRLTGAPVTHLVSEPPRPAIRSVAAPAHHRHGVMSALSVLEWGAPGSRLLAGAAMSRRSSPRPDPARQR
jgi:hypothetical protein